MSSEAETTLEDNSAEAEVNVSVRHGFEVAGRGFLIMQGVYCEVASRVSICAIPDSPAAFLGFINHRGDTVPVFSLERVADSRADTSGRWVLLIDQGASTVGILLENYPQGLHNLSPIATDAQADEVTSNSAQGQDDLFAEFSGKPYALDQQVWRDFDHRRFAAYVKRSFAAAAQQNEEAN